MARISIIGSGNFGTALAKIFSKNNLVHIYSIDEKAIGNINIKRENSEYLPGIKLNKNIFANDNLADIQESEIIVFCTPSSVFRQVAKHVRIYYSNQIVVSASKGVGPKGELLTDIIAEELQCPDSRVLALSGPSIAIELAQGKPTHVILGGDRKSTQVVKRAFQTDTFFLRCTRDKNGIELLGFYKNILAILVGLCDGLELGNNFKSALITKSYSEFYYLNQNKNIRRHSFIDYAGLGDLYVTSTCPGSRNRTFGSLLAKYNSIEKIQEKIGQVIEGYDNLLRLDKMKGDFYEWNLIKTLLNVIKAKTKQEKSEALTKYLRSFEIRAIIFDWGNVITRDYYSRHVAKKLAKEYGLKSEEVLAVLESNELNLLKGKEKFKDFHKNIIKTYPQIKYESFKKAYIDSLTWNKGMLKLIKELRGQYKTYILSNNYDILTPTLKKDLKEYFDGMVFSNEVGDVKPNEKIFTHLIKKYDIRPENSIFIDDTQKHLETADRMQFCTVRFKGVKQLKEAMSDLIIK